VQIVQFTPPQIAKLLKTDPATVKRWIYRGLLKSNKTTGGHYRISEEQFKDFISKYQNNSKGSYVVSRLKKNIDKNQGASLSNYYNLLRSYKWEESMEVLISLYASGLRISQILDGFVAPVLRKIGEDWLSGKISIYEEHKISFMIDRNLFELGSFIGAGVSKINSKKALLFCAPKDEHIIPLEMINLVLKENGWDSSILGKDLPLNELEKAIKDISPNLVCITKISGEKINASFIIELKKISKKYKCEVVLGGSGWDTGVIKKIHFKHFNSLYDFDQYLSV
jgi:MerR family transcriptional regulator, light-induced transcriptional regulator